MDGWLGRLGSVRSIIVWSFKGAGILESNMGMALEASNCNARGNPVRRNVSCLSFITSISTGLSTGSYSLLD